MCHANAVRALLKGEQPDLIPIADGKRTTSPGPARTAHLDSLEQQLQDILGLKVRIRQKDRQSGNVVITFRSDGDFENLMRLLRKAA